jgi:hypothetical protein
MLSGMIIGIIKNDKKHRSLFAIEVCLKQTFWHWNANFIAV